MHTGLLKQTCVYADHAAEHHECGYQGEKRVAEGQYFIERSMIMPQIGKANKVKWIPLPRDRKSRGFEQPLLRMVFHLPFLCGKHLPGSRNRT